MKRLIYIFTALVLTQTLQAQKVDRSKVPAPGPTPEVQLKEATKYTLKNGIRLYVVEDHKIPKVTLYTRFDFEQPLEGKRTGLNNLIGDMLMSGTKVHTKDEINKMIDGMGADFRIGPNTIYASSLTRHFDHIMKLGAEMILQPKLDPKELDLLKNQMKSGLETEKDDPDAQLSNLTALMNFGDKHPYGELPTKETVDNIDLKSCEVYAGLYFRPNNAYMAIVGDIKPEEAKAMVEKYFAMWQQAEVPKSTYQNKPAPKDKQVVFIPKTGAVQSNIGVTYPLDYKANAPDAHAISAMNYILGGGSNSRLFKNLRESHGWTYGAYSRLSPNELKSNFLATAKTRNEVTDSSVNEILAEMQNMIAGNFDDEEVKGAKASAAGSFGRSLENPLNLAKYAVNQDLYNLKDGYYKNYLKDVAALTKDDISAAAKKYLHTDQAYIIVSGNKDQVMETLKKFDSDGKIDVRDYQGKEIVEKAVDANITAEKIIQNYINATGGEKVWSSIKDIYTKAEGSMSGFELIFEQWRTDGKLKSEVSAAGAVQFKSVYNDGKGYMEQGGQKVDMTAKELEENKISSYIMPELKYAQNGCKFKLNGIENVNGSDAYSVTIIAPNGSESIDFFDKKTYYKIRSVSTQEAQGQTMTQTVDFQNYKDVTGGIKMPFTSIISAGPQKITSEVVDVKVNEGIADSIFK